MWFTQGRLEPRTFGMQKWHSTTELWSLNYILFKYLNSWISKGHDPIEPCSCWARALWTAAFPRETEMALAHFGRGISHPPRVPLEAVFNSLKAGIGGIWEKQRPESARVIWKSIYYAKMTKIVNLGFDQQFSPNNKVFFLHIYLQKNIAHFPS